jgi:oleate hydratase
MCRRGESLPSGASVIIAGSPRAAQMAIYELLSIDRKIPPVTPHDKSLQTQFEALLKAFR